MMNSCIEFVCLVFAALQILKQTSMMTCFEMSAVRRSMVRMFQHLKVYPFITPRTEGGCMKAEDRLKQRCREFSSYFPRLSACISSNMLVKHSIENG